WTLQSDANTLPPLDVAGDSAAAAPGALNAAKLYEQRVRTVVAISSAMGNSSPITGTGVVVDAEQGLIVTASHVIKSYDGGGVDATSITVKFKQGDQVRAQRVAIDQNNDLAILKINPAEIEGGLVAAPLGDSNAVITGSEVAAIGGPFNYEFSMQPGTVSYVHRAVESRINNAWEIPDTIQVDGAGINKGSSGGPLFNARGQVIGIMQQIPTTNGDSAGLSFAVASSIVKRALDYWAETGKTNISYAYTGMTAKSVTPQLDKQAQLGTTVGAVLQTSQGAAQAAGLRGGTRQVNSIAGSVLLGDVIVELAGQKIRSNEDLARVAGLLIPGRAVDVSYVRAGERHDATLTPTEVQLF
ncbi:MAG: hypothetical protein JWM25_1439, partial [Thermoleophilia bacterium]|nr:hypothetical protein [Thermoleophilia bacterium]